MHPYRNSRGFSLIELMVVVVIIGILAAIAYPSYRSHVIKTTRADCEGALVGFANAMERRFTETGSYLGAATAGGNTGAPAATTYPAQCPIDGSNKTYDLKISAATQTTYTLQAVPVAGGPQASDVCGTLALDQTGAKSASGGTVTTCWK